MTIIQSYDHTITYDYGKYVVLYSVDCAEYATTKKIAIVQRNITGLYWYSK